MCNPFRKSHFIRDPSHAFLDALAFVKLLLIFEQKYTVLPTYRLHRLERPTQQSIQPKGGRSTSLSGDPPDEATGRLPKTQMQPQRGKWLHKERPSRRAPARLPRGADTKTAEPFWGALKWYAPSASPRRPEAVPGLPIRQMQPQRGKWLHQAVPLGRTHARLPPRKHSRASKQPGGRI